MIWDILHLLNFLVACLAWALRDVEEVLRSVATCLMGTFDFEKGVFPSLSSFHRLPENIIASH